MSTENTKFKLGVCGYPLSRGKETGRGLERVIEEFCNFLTRKQISYDFYDKGIIQSEFVAVLTSFPYLWQLRKASNSCYLAVYAVSGIFPALLKKRPLVTLITDLIPFEVYGYDNWLKYAIKRWCIKYSCLRSDFLIAASSSIKDGIVSRFGIEPDKVAVVPWGVDLGAYFPDSKVRKIDKRILFLGELKMAKGIDSVIRAFRLVLEKMPDATLSIAGSGRDKDDMMKLAASLLPENSYQFEGFVPEEEMNALYNSAELFIFPSRYGFGLSALEAMACGTPSLVGETLDAKDFFTDKDLFVNPEDPGQMAERMLYLLQNRDARLKKSAQAVTFAQSFSWDHMSEKYLAYCEQTINSSEV